MASKRHDWLEERAKVQERPSPTETAVAGLAIARFREMFNSVAT